ncbi:hypothetical protein AWM75_05660 [Aerococcus urinaehominis]|uniref:Uncharacterized protein n=1 Tax=Aerococcus urinaehominis TaxID=128944 RepID=A0A0X8FLH1_9LACT|nr:two-component system regulatory protein YycI [Aerococcus urinaehominis]AMB99513.1 hypothetical protein AWM75_05660 [Aerococcus urinaehominis]SDM25822.1 Two-component signal transduction system YycFG, regulatory protein YycI [Aerococcus urinaehominis]
MDFRRIEKLLIFAFLLLNIFLVYVFVGKNSLLILPRIDQSQVNVAAEMKADGIKFTDLSDEIRDLPLMRVPNEPLLTNENTNFANQTVTLDGGNRLVSQLNTNIVLSKLTSDVSASEITNEMLAPLENFVNADNIVAGDSYQFFYYDAINRRIHYIQFKDGNIPITDGTSELIFHLDNNFNVSSYEQRLVATMKTQGSARKLISEKQAVENLYLNDEISDQSTILRRTLGYNVTLPLTDMTVYTPVWCVVVAEQDGAISRHYVDGINGTIIQVEITNA